jgi:hypothetical protein
VFHVGGAEAVKKVGSLIKEDNNQNGINALSAGLLMKGMVGGSPPEMGVAGTICSCGPFMTPPSPWGALIRGALVCRLSTFMEGETSGMTKEGGEGGFCEGELGLSGGRREVLQWGESNLSDSRPWMGGEEG